MAHMVVIYRTPKDIEAFADITSRFTCLWLRSLRV
ncbi:hypothetical protein HDF11_000572 [Tunturiibacter psychrotolerans]